LSTFDRAVLYGDLGEFLVPGFLSTTIDVDGHRYAVRSLTQNDLYLVQKRVSQTDPSWRLHLAAQSVWMVDGTPLLEDSTLAYRAVLESLGRSTKPLVLAMVGTIYGFFARMREANYFLESYLYEEESRRLWRALGSGRYHPSHKTVIPGVERLGLNPLQSAWISWNQIEDRRDDQEYVWSNTKVLVSLQSHKGYESLNNRDRQRDENERGRRAEVQEKAVQRFLHGPEPEDPKSAPTGDSVRKARTTDELEDEMRRWISGDLDWHDQVVEAYKDRIRQQQEERESQKEAVIAEIRAQREREERDLGVQKPTLRGITPEEMARLKEGTSSGAKHIVEADPVSRAFNRYLRPTVDAGNLSVDMAGRIIEKPPTVPGGNSKVTLAEQVASRKVVMDDDIPT
jgi:hypothetical protein